MVSPNEYGLQKKFLLGGSVQRYSYPESYNLAGISCLVPIADRMIECLAKLNTLLWIAVDIAPVPVRVRFAIGGRKDRIA